MLNGALPSFDLAEGGFLLSCIRSLCVAALFCGFGALVFLTLVAPRSLAGMTPPISAIVVHRLLRLVRASLITAIAAMLCWLVFEGAVIANATSFYEITAAVPAILIHTRFGQVIALQLITLCAALASLSSSLTPAFGHRLATLSAGAGVTLQTGYSHALAMYGGPSLLLVSDVLHLLCAGAWLGGLLPLLLVVRLASPKDAAVAARSFSLLGKLCVIGVVVSAAFQGWILIGGFPELIGSAYGWVAFCKFGLLLVLLAFAAINRYRLAPALVRQGHARARRTLITSLALQTTIGLLVIFAAGLLSSLPPSLHLQPVWPFTKQPSLVTLQEDAGFKIEVFEAVLALAGAVFLIALGVALKKLRWPAIISAIIIIGLAVPHLDLLLVEAYPTSFYQSPTNFAATSISSGAALYPQHCASCHGAGGRGDGPSAMALTIAPADLTADHLWEHSDGELFWWLSHGVETPEGTRVMPGFANILTEDQRWNIIDYIRSHNAGIVHKTKGIWSPPIPAPSFRLSCHGRDFNSLTTLRGKVVRLVFSGGVPPVQISPSISGVDFISVFVTLDGHTVTKAVDCAAQDPAIGRAYALLAGIEPAQLAGGQILIDPNGWLRDIQLFGKRWANPQTLMAEIQQICSHPIAGKEGSHAHHH